MTTDSVATLQRHVLHSRQYLENGLLALQHGDAGKAGELLWGSVAQALHAVAAYRNTPVGTHRDLKNFALQLARNLNDPAIEKDFIIAENLHYNFYVAEREPVDIQIVVPTVRELMAKLLNLIPPETIRQAITP